MLHVPHVQANDAKDNNKNKNIYTYIYSNRRCGVSFMVCLFVRLKGEVYDRYKSIIFGF